VIPGDIAAELARVIRSQVASGALPGPAATLTADGTWRNAAQGRPPGSYATSLPFELAALADRPSEEIAAQLTEPLADLAWVSSAEATGGYLTITVTAGYLARLPARIVAAGPDCAHSSAMAGSRLTAPHRPDLAVSPNWPTAWRAQHDAVIGHLGQAAGADVLFIHSENNAPGTAPSGPRLDEPPAAVAHYGVDAVRYALSRVSEPRQTAIQRQLSHPLDLSNPFFLTRYAHADAASTLRWAAELRLSAHRDVPDLRMPPAAGRADLQHAELELIDVMSWLPERAAAAFRRRRPTELTTYLEDLALAWLDCSERHPALSFRGRGAPAEPGGITAAARLELAEASMTALAAGLGLLMVAAPAMM
jgi:arginyl-tRNA synthetase